MSLPTSQKHLQVESDDSLQTGQKKKIGCVITYFILAFITLFLSVISIRYDFLELALNERIKLRPGFPPYEKWRNPSSVEIAVKLYLFAVENPTEFLANPEAKLKLKEIGPIYYKKIMTQEDIVFHDEDSTMSYTTVYRLEYIEEMNEPDILNKTITTINPVLLGLAAMIHDQFIAKIAFDFLASKDHVFLNKTVYEALWNSTSPMLEMVKQIPFAAPRPNAGIMYNSFYPTTTRYNVNIGPKHGYENFFKINTLNGKPRINAYGENFPKHCPFSLVGASEGTGLPPHLSKDTVIQAFTNNLCRTYPMVYNQTVKVGALDTYEFIFAPDIYKRAEDPEKDCMGKTGGVMLPDGLIDSSKCALGTPVALSNPHFWGFHGAWENYIEGLEPSREKHSSHILVEPTSGIQLEAIARIQSNIPLPSLDYYPPEVKRFSRMILPQFWMEYSVKNNDEMIRGMIIFFINMPVIQPIIVILLLTLSLFAVYKTVKLMMTFNMKKSWNVAKEKKKTKVIDNDVSEHYINAFSDNSLDKTTM
ncbi:lysosome membrane protein 2-like [Episyrphus balteatus]|uniref:lysosome membrane protein 2-like n=1 Tax=Episyrphus balteatus TaxID=286459 RepID=UPI00248543C7|nr:lysosome membrane protein 2-like [Episyrphus balteatus]